MGQISHTGKVIDIREDKISVEIVSRAACQECGARHNCGLAECKSKIIEVSHLYHDTFSVGEEVSVSVEAYQGFEAVWLVYFAPLLLVMITLCTCLFCGLSEQNSGIFSIIILIPYYFGLFLLRKKLQRHFRFTISKQ